MEEIVRVLQTANKLSRAINGGAIIRKWEYRKSFWAGFYINGSLELTFIVVPNFVMRELWDDNDRINKRK